MYFVHVLQMENGQCFLVESATTGHKILLCNSDLKEKLLYLYDDYAEKQGVSITPFRHFLSLGAVHVSGLSILYYSRTTFL